MRANSRVNAFAAARSAIINARARARVLRDSFKVFSPPEIKIAAGARGSNESRIFLFFFLSNVDMVVPGV